MSNIRITFRGNGGAGMRDIRFRGKRIV